MKRKIKLTEHKTRGISNQSAKMSSSSRKCKCEHYGFDLSFATLEEKEAFLQRLQNVRRLMTIAGAPLLENQNLVYALLDLAESGSHPTPDPHIDNAGPATRSFMRNSGKL